MTDPLDTRRRKARFRSWHRGMREADLIMGGFADAQIAGLNDTPLFRRIVAHAGAVRT
jgi:antitoxin CptB